MARFEAHPAGIAFICIAASEVARMSAECPGLIETFQNGGAVARGASKPFRLTVTPSWNSGHPIVGLPCGGIAVEVDRPAVAGLSPRTAALLDELEIIFQDGGFEIAEARGSKRAKLETSNTDVEAAILAAVARCAVTEAALRFLVPDHKPAEISKGLEALLSARKIGYDGDTLVLIDSAATAVPARDEQDVVEDNEQAEGAAASADEVPNAEPETIEPPEVEKPPYSTLVQIRKAVTRAGPNGIDISTLSEQTGLPLELVERSLDYLAWRHQVFKDEGLFRLPDDDGRRDVFDWVNEFLHDAGGPRSSEAIVKALGEIHPAWVHKTLETMVRRNQVNFDGSMYTFRMPERFKRSTGYLKVRELIEKSSENGVAIDQIADALPDFPFWLIRQNIRRLAQSGRVVIRDETCYWNPETIVSQPSKPRLSFREEVREALRQAGPQGLTRERVIEMFTESHNASTTKISIALNELINRSEAVLRSKHYRFVPTAPASHNA